MRRAVLILLSFVVGGSARDIPLGVERTRDLGHGFHRDIIAEAAPPNAHVFESVGHFEYLFYHKEKLAALNSCECLLAPGGHAIVYQEGHSGNIFLFERESGRTVRLTQKFPGLAMRMTWQAPNKISAIVSSSQSPEGNGTWLTLTIPRT